MQYISSRNMSISTPKIHKVLDSPIDSTPWMQSSSTTSTNPAEQYYSSNNNSTNMMTDNDADVYMSDTKSNRSRNSTTDMCVEKNTEGKPPYSYATLIKYAIERSSENKLTLSQIYQWVIDHYPYYGSAGSGWKNSIRHNLSLNKSFVRVPRPVNEPGKGSYWTVDQYAVDTEQRVRTNVRGRSSRSSSDSSLHRANHSNANNGGTDPWLLGLNNVNRNFRDGRSLSTDAGVTSSASALRRTSQYGYCGHPYGGFERSFNNPTQYGYSNYHTYGQQRMPSHETLLSARQHSSVTYSLPTSATVHHSQSTPFNGYSNTNNIYSSMNAQQQQQQQQSFYSHRQSCPDLTNIPASAANYSETNSILPNFNTTGNEVCLESASASNMCESKMMYSPSNNHGFTTPNSYSTENKPFPSNSSSSSSPIKGNHARSLVNEGPMSSFFKPEVSNNKAAGLPSPVLSPSNCSSTTSSQHLSVVDPLSVVTQHPSPVTAAAAAAASLTASVTTPGNNNRLKSPYRLAIQRTSSSSNSVEECLTSPSSPLVMTTANDSSSPMSTTLDGGVRSPVPFCMDSVAYIDMVSQHQQQQNASLVDDHSLSSSSSQHDVCSPQPSMEGNNKEYKFNSHQQEKYSQMISATNNNKTTTANSFLAQNY